MSLDVEFVAHLVRTGCVAAAQEAGISEEMLEGDGRKMYEGILEFWKKYRAMPSPTAFFDMTMIRLDGIEDRGLDSLDYYVDRIRDRHAETFIRSGLAKADSEHFQVGAFQDYIRTASSTLRRAAEIWKGRDRVVTFADMNKERMAAYTRAESVGTGIIGIPTPWPLINEATGGIVPSDYVLVVGKRKLGKSWIMAHMVLAAALAGARVLVVPMEMPILAFQARILCIAGFFSPKDVKMGRLYKAKARWFEFMTQFGDQFGDNILFAPRRRVSTSDDLTILVEEHDPDITFVDGMYLLDKRKYPKMNRVERLEMTSGDFREIALSGDRVMVGSHQFNRDQGEDEVEVSLDSVGMSDSLTFDPSIILGLSASPKMLKTPQNRVLSLMKNREGEEERALLNWSFLRPDFSEIGQYKDPEPDRGRGGGRRRGAETSPDRVDF